MIDGAPSHYSIEGARYAIEAEIIVYLLLENATQNLQPLDTHCMQPMKTAFAHACEELRYRERKADPNMNINKKNFPRALALAMEDFLKEKTIINGFAFVGIFPYNNMAPYDHLERYAQNVQNKPMKQLYNKLTAPIKAPAGFVQPTRPMIADADIAIGNEHDFVLPEPGDFPRDEIKYSYVVTKFKSGATTKSKRVRNICTASSKFVSYLSQICNNSMFLFF